jgi:hypothetical protein
MMAAAVHPPDEKQAGGLEPILSICVGWFESDGKLVI